MKRKLFRIDWLLIAPVIVLIIFSLTILYSINPLFFRGQLTGLIIGILAFLFFSQINLALLVSFAKPIYISALILFFIILILGIESHGAIRWVDIAGIRLQFSEIYKPFLAISMAAFLTRRNSTQLKSFFLFFLMLMPLVFFLALQPDLGNALIYIGVGILTLLIYGYPIRWFLLLLVPVLFSTPFLWLALHDYQRQRIMTFLHPKNNALGSSYNVIQATIAIGSGMLTGRGLGQGTQSGLRFLPERQTDFIFATLSEGLGFVGSMVIILALFLTCYRMYVIYAHAEDPFYKILSACLLSFLIVHIFVNIGMNVGLLPIVGITLPFVSLGGSSLLANMIIVGILSNISTMQRRRDVLEIR